MTDRSHVVPPASMLKPNADGTPNTVMIRWMTSVTVTFYGAGSPEGVVEARITSQYMDTTGTAGSILYVKRDQDVAGDRKKGWILV